MFSGVKQNREREREKELIRLHLMRCILFTHCIHFINKYIYMCVCIFVLFCLWKYGPEHTHTHTHYSVRNWLSRTTVTLCTQAPANGQPYRFALFLMKILYIQHIYKIIIFLELKMHWLCYLVGHICNKKYTCTHTYTHI